MRYTTEELEAFGDILVHDRMTKLTCPRCQGRLRTKMNVILDTSETTCHFECKSCGCVGDAIMTLTRQGYEFKVVGLLYEELYEEMEALGAGGMGEVVRVVSRQNGKSYAAKKIRKDRSASEDAILRFERELKVMQKLLEHPNIIRLVDVFLSETSSVIVMELAEKELTTMINDTLNTSNQELAFAFRGLCQGLSYLHQANIIHRDLKPSNVLIGSHGDGKVADFGLAMYADRTMTTLTQSGWGLGTQHYMAPEQRRDAKNLTTTKSDIYALGLIGYEILTRESPYDFKLECTGEERIWKLIEQCLHRNGDRRPDDPVELADAMDDYFGVTHTAREEPEPSVSALDLASILDAWQQIAQEKNPNESMLYHLMKNEELDLSKGPLMGYLQALLKGNKKLFQRALELGRESEK